MATITESLAWAMQSLRSGNLDLAEQIYRQILQAAPANADAQHFLGVVAYQKGRFQEAALAMRCAAELRPDVAAFRYNLGLAHDGLGQLQEAAAAYRQAIDLQPDYTDAYNNLGNALLRLGQLDEAAAQLRQALQLRPADADIHSNLGNVLQKQERWDEAEAAYRQALQLKPHSAEALNNLGNALKRQGRLEEAVASYQQAIGFNPQFAEAFNNVGNALAGLGRWDDAVANFQQALRINPRYSWGYYNLGNALMDQGRPGDAANCYRQAVQIDPSFAEAFNNLGNALRDQNRLGEAIAAFQRALSINPKNAGAHTNLGNTFWEKGQWEEAVTHSRRAVELEPGNVAALSELVHELQHICQWDGLKELSQRVIDSVTKPGDMGTAEPAPPFYFIALHTPTTAEQQLQASRRRVERHYKSTLPMSGRTDWQSVPPADEKSSLTGPPRITLGYLSSDFHAHATAYLVAELFEKHDRGNFKVYGYSHGPDDGSPMRRRLAAAFDQFVDLRKASSAEAARRIRADQVDILIDLKGYTTNSRTQILALRPAPIEVNYLGFPGTMGAPFIDYILVDDFVVPADQQAFFTENLVHLTGCYQVNDSRREISPHTPSRAECGLPEHGFVFCCFNNNYKITPEVFEVWMRLLKARQDSVLWLFEANPLAAANLRREAETRGVAAPRLVFAPKVDLPEHLARHRLANLFLDTFPVNAHTTASDALWAGCPVLTVAGQTFIGRVAGSLLRSLGLPELISTSLSDYHALALRLASDADLLQALKTRLQANRMTSALFDAGKFVEGLEKAYATMWDIHRAGEKPRPFAVR